VKCYLSMMPSGLALSLAPSRRGFEPQVWRTRALFFGNFPERDEKTLSSAPCLKHRSKASPVSRELWCRCVWMGQRFGSFFDLHEKVFFLSTMSRGCLTPTGRVFFYLSMMLFRKIYCKKHIGSKVNLDVQLHNL
jgi:hypothetical protein